MLMDHIKEESGRKFCTTSVCEKVKDNCPTNYWQELLVEDKQKP